VYHKVLQSANTEQKVRILIANKDKSGIISEIPRNRVLEPTTDLFLELYAGKDLAIEFPKCSNGDSLKLAKV
jgi:hypothetical protein